MDLQTKLVNIKNIELKTRNGINGEFKQFSVEVEPKESGVYYSFNPKKKDGSLTRAFEIYKMNKAAWDDKLLMGETIPALVSFQEKVNSWNKDGKSGTTRYRNIIMFAAPLQNAETQRVEDAGIPLDDINF